VIAGVDIKYAYEDPVVKQKHWATPPGQSHLNSPSPDALAFHKQLEDRAEGQAPATVIGQAVATLDEWTIRSEMGKFRFSRSISFDLHFCLTHLPCLYEIQ